jgi:hypothetical protein
MRKPSNERLLCVICWNRSLQVTDQLTSLGCGLVGPGTRDVPWLRSAVRRVAVYYTCKRCKA